MKVNELRIGNWIMGYHNPFQWGLEHFDLLKKADLDEIIKKPIPLTEELLLKCGFVNKGDSLLGYVFAKSFAYHITKRRNYFAFRMNTLSDKSVFVREVKYLHELQNLYYAITGEELEVKL